MVHGVSHFPAVQDALAHSEADVQPEPGSFFGKHARAVGSQNWDAVQSAEVAHVVPHAPATQIGPAWVGPVQSAFVAHFPHVPSDFTYGFAAVGQGCVAVLPLSPLAGPHDPSVLQTGLVAEEHERVAALPLPPLQPAQVPVVESHVGVVAEHALALVAEHAVH